MVESRPQQNNDPKKDTVVIKLVRIKKTKSAIRTLRVHSNASKRETNSTESPFLQQTTTTSKELPNELSVTSNRPIKAALGKGASRSSRISLGFLDRICHPTIQYKLFLLFLSIWGASFILFYLSINFAVILPESFNLLVLGFFLASTSLTGIYTFLLGLQHLRSTPSSRTSTTSYLQRVD